MKSIAFFLLTLLPVFYGKNPNPKIADGYKSYCNSRFQYCIDYPDFLIPKPESENGDGRIFENKKGAKILTVFGRINQDADGNPLSLKTQFESDIKTMQENRKNITYKKLGKTFYVLSGTDNEKTFYQKTIIKKDAFCFAILTYSKQGKMLYDSVTGHIAASFK
jgi:hypothetical protein